MIKIAAFLLDENISITIDNGNISINTKNNTILELVKSIYSELLDSYSPADGSLGEGMAQELVKIGAKITEVIEPQAEDGVVY